MGETVLYFPGYFQCFIGCALIVHSVALADLIWQAVKVQKSFAVSQVSVIYDTHATMWHTKRFKVACLTAQEIA